MVDSKSICYKEISNVQSHVFKNFPGGCFDGNRVGPEVVHNDKTKRRPIFQAFNFPRWFFVIKLFRYTKLEEVNNLIMIKPVLFVLSYQSKSTKVLRGKYAI